MKIKPIRGQTSVDFFMGCNSPNGFYSLYSELQRPVKGVRRYLIKGGAGTGKSSIMRRAAAEFGPKDALTELIHCSSDPNSLDGVILHTGKTSMVDATPPHVIEPTYPGGFETVINLCEYFDEEKLESRLEDIVVLQSANGECHRKCRGLLKCADILLRDNFYYVESCTDFAKIGALSRRICKAELKTSASGTGMEHRRLLSAVTNQGVITYTSTASALCDRFYLLRDEYGVSSNALLGQIRDAALERGYDLFSCYCPFSPESKLEHLFIPELRLGFVTQSRFNDFSDIASGKCGRCKVINYTRFTDLDRLRLKKQYLSFNKKAAAELVDAAVDHLKQAKVIHDELESMYTDAVDFTRVTEKTDQILSRMAKRYQA